MPTVPRHALDTVDEGAYRVLLTGFGPLGHFKENPSWLAVKPLHNTVLELDSPIDPVVVEDRMIHPMDTVAPQPGIPWPRQIHITALKIPVTYEAVLDVTPRIHARPPDLPPSDDPTLPTIPAPEAGYDFIFHIGVAGRGVLRMERVGHKIGYNMKDALGQPAPAVPLSKEDASRQTVDMTDVEMMERIRLGLPMIEPHAKVELPPIRGYGKGYEMFADDLHTEIDVPRVVEYINTQYNLAKGDYPQRPTVNDPYAIDPLVYYNGTSQDSAQVTTPEQNTPPALIKARGKIHDNERIYTSMDAGHYLCDFLYYGSLAESKRTVMRHERVKGSKVLFMHCPPVDQPLSTEEVTATIKDVLMWVCSQEK
ncbi:hypothetical protein PLICRDRAFT_50700 [Plicaturopsis crispa FD-325 SS-3]|nr:hypothetical protein PLICRDRAFT_50700 [Plicaturopsis crispa FD-325 SS-3]